jgi:hypothetical protein
VAHSVIEDVAFASRERNRKPLRVSCQRTPMAAQISKFVSRADYLHVRGMRDYCRWNRCRLNRVTEDEWRQWKADAFADRKADAEWAKYHGPVEGGAWVARFPWPPITTPTKSHRRRKQRVR